MLDDIYIGIMNDEQFELSKELWKECFREDDDRFVDWYYSARSKPEYALGAFEKKSETPVAMLHMLPAKISVDDLVLKASFIAGVCTKPEHRRKGLCAKLMEKAFGLMKEQGSAAAILQPFDFDFYRQFGFEPFVYRRSVTLSDECTNDVGRTSENLNADDALVEKLFKIYNGFMKSYCGWTIRDTDYFKSLIEEYSAPGAELIISEKGCCAGYADTEKSDVFIASELFFEFGCDPVSLLPAGYRKYVFPLPLDYSVPRGCRSSIEPFNMIRYIDDTKMPIGGILYSFDRY